MNSRITTFLICTAVLVAVVVIYYTDFRKIELQHLGEKYITDSLEDVHSSRELLRTRETVGKFLKAVDDNDYDNVLGYWFKSYDYDKNQRQQKNLKLIVDVLKSLKQISYVSSSYFDATRSYEPYYGCPFPPKPAISPATLHLVAEGNWHGVNRSGGGLYYLENYKANHEDFAGLEITFYLTEGYRDKKSYIREILITGPQPLILKLLEGQDYEIFSEGSFYFPISDLQRLEKSIVKDKWTVKQCDQLLEYKDFCINKVAILWKDPSLCSRLDQISTRDRCIDSVAKEAKDISICEQITGSYIRDDCIEYVAKRLQDAKLCEKCSAETSEYSYASKRMYCYSSFALEKGDISLCDMSGSIRDNCIKSIAKKLQNEKICEKCSEEERAACYLEVAIAKKDVGLCERNEKKYDFCIETIAMNLLDENLCKKCSEKQKISCYEHVVKAKENYKRVERYLNRFNPNFSR